MIRIHPSPVSALHFGTLLSTITTAFIACGFCALTQPAFGAGIEDPNPLRAADYIVADQLAGPDFKVDPAASTDGFNNVYTLTSRFGSWTGRGRAGLAMRIREIQALAQLEEVSKSDVFVNAVKTSATAPLKLVQSVATQPAETVKGIPSGVGRWVKKTSFQVKEGYHDVKQTTAKDSAAATDGGDAAAKSKAAKGEAAAVSYGLGYLKITAAERQWYGKLGVDPYTDNELLRDAVQSVARVQGLTTFGMKFVGLPSIPGAGEIRRTMDLVWKTDPTELKMANRKQLLAAGLSEETARAFEDNPAMSPTMQTALVSALGSLAGVTGRDRLIASAIGAKSREAAAMLVSSVTLLVRLHRQEAPLREILAGALLPVARTAKGELVATQLADALFWTAAVAAEAGEFAALHANDPAKVRQFWVVGDASSAFKAGARELGWEVHDRWQLAAPEDAAVTAPPPAR